MDKGSRPYRDARYHWPDRRLTDLFRIEHPLVLAPMAGVGTVELAAAVGNAGGLGSIGCGAMNPAAVSETVTRLRALTVTPINLNFFCHDAASPDIARETAWSDRLASYYRAFGFDRRRAIVRSDLPPFDDAMCAVVEQTRPEVVSFHFGLPETALLDRVKSTGCCVISSATTVAEALWLEARGIDAVIAQGIEAGGHRATFLFDEGGFQATSQPSTLTLVPQIVDAVSVPVIAAGGIGDARGIAAAFKLGAAGVQMGTAYLRCPEAATSQLHREALRRAAANSTVVSNVFTGRPARVLANRLTREIGPMFDSAPRFPLSMAALAPLRNEAEARGHVDFTALWAGQAAPIGRDLPAEAVTRMLADAFA
jgi:nitronate monooxygenase